MRRDDEAPHTTAGGSKGRGGPVEQGTAHRIPSPDSVSELVREIRLAGNNATIFDLAFAHDPRAFVISESVFTCPLCHQPRARIRTAVEWTCATCRKDSTIFELFRLALERPAVLERLRAVGG
jgi:hypothetical protein